MYRVEQAEKCDTNFVVGLRNTLRITMSVRM